MMVVAGEKLPPLTSPKDFGTLSGFRKVPGHKFRPAAQAKLFVLRCLTLTQSLRIVNIEGYRQKWYAGCLKSSLTSDVS